MRLMKKSLVILLMLSMSLAGCAGMGAQTTNVHYYPKCYEPLARLRQAQTEMARNVLIGAVAGAAVGAGAGLLLGGGKARNAAIGAVVGGVAGAVGGYALTKRGQIKEDKARYASYCADIDKDMDTLDSAIVAARLAQKCYEQQFDLLLQDMKAGRIKKTEAQVRFQEIQDGSAEAARILGEVGDKAKEKNQEYQNALQVEAQQIGVSPDELRVAAVRTSQPPAVQAPPPAPAVEQAPPAKTKAKAKQKAKAKPKVKEEPPKQPVVVAPPKPEEIDPKLKDKDELLRLQTKQQRLGDQTVAIDASRDEEARKNQFRMDTFKAVAGDMAG